MVNKALKKAAILMIAGSLAGGIPSVAGSSAIHNHTAGKSALVSCQKSGNSNHGSNLLDNVHNSVKNIKSKFTFNL